VQPDTALQLATNQLKRVRDEIGKIIVGQQDVVDGVLICLLAGGHVLLEGVPGLGKTTLLRTLSRVLHLKYSRIQFTPDLMPADIIGSEVLDEGADGRRSFRFVPGPVLFSGTPTPSYGDTAVAWGLTRRASMRARSAASSPITQAGCGARLSATPTKRSVR